MSFVCNEQNQLLYASSASGTDTYYYQKYRDFAMKMIAGDQQAIKRGAIIRNAQLHLPVLAGDGRRKFVVAYVPAWSNDNSVVAIAEEIEHPQHGLSLELCNIISFSDLATRKKIPMRTPEQIQELKEVLLRYNGRGAADYENVARLLVDSGSSGGGARLRKERRHLMMPPCWCGISAGRWWGDERDGLSLLCWA